MLDKQRFAPTPFLGVLVNPFYIIRRRLHKHISEVAANSKGRLLDFGCGRMPYRHLFSQVESYTGLDIEVSGHPNEKKFADVYYDGKRIPFENSTFDIVFSSEVFEHIFNIDDVLKETYRVVKPGGSLIVTVPFAFPEHEEPYDFARYTSFGLQAVLERNGFRTTKLIKIGSYVLATGQQISAYFFGRVSKNKLVQFLIQLILCAPINLLTEILARILPEDDSLFCGQLIVAERIA
jgi:SAM-dependent methyltransferase